MQLSGWKETIEQFADKEGAYRQQLTVRHLCTSALVYVCTYIGSVVGWQYEVNMYAHTYVCSSPLLLQYLYCLCITICTTSLVCVYIHNKKPSTECYKLHVHIQYISTVHTYIIELSVGHLYCLFVCG